VNGVLDRALEALKAKGGNPGRVERWGRRTFAYEVQHKREGYYVVIELTASRPPWPTWSGSSSWPTRCSGTRPCASRTRWPAVVPQPPPPPSGRPDMAPGNAITLVGNVTRDPELRFTTPARPPPASAWPSIGGGRTARPRSGKRRCRSSTWCVGARWRENAAESLTKGSRVIVTGRLDQRSWETPDGDKRSKVEVVADEVGPSIRWATAQITKNERRGSRRGWPRWGKWRRWRRWRRSPGVVRWRWRPGRRAPGLRIQRGAFLVMARNNDLEAPPAALPRTRGGASRRSPCALCKDRVEWVDYKDVGLLRKYMSDRGKIRARRGVGQLHPAPARRGHRHQNRP